MQTILGPFHPFLEDELVKELVRDKRDDPLRPLLILLPSDALRRRVKIIMAREHRLTLVHVRLLTFHQLAAILAEEFRGERTPTLSDDLFFEELVRQVIRARAPGTEAFAGIEDRAGGSGALWQTLRDLRDSGLDPQMALEALREPSFGAAISGRTSDLLRLVQTLERICREKRVEDRSDIARLAADRVSTSRFLAEFARIFYYGFYDLTQIQLDFFSAVARAFPVTLFFPLLKLRPGHGGWLFADRFYQRYLQGLAMSDVRNTVEADIAPLSATYRLFDEVEERAYRAPPDHWRARVLSAFGSEDEVSAVAKEIVRLVGDESMRFDEIGVAARGLEDYGATIKRIFIDHQIPIQGALEEPLTQFPLAKAVVLLLRLPVKDFLRSQVIDLLSSPYFRPGSRRSHFVARPDLWDLATRELAICKGMSQWRRLLDHRTRGLTFSRLVDPNGDGEAPYIRIPAEQIRVLADLVDGLARDLSDFPQQAAWGGYSELWKRLFAKYLGLLDNSTASGKSADDRVGTQILDILDKIAGLDVLGEPISLAKFCETFEHWLERATIAATPDNVPGVTVLGATGMRGLSFRALFVLGVNEGIFPRTIREDAFLRDRERDIFERDLGYKISQKLAGFDEEKLLFSLLVNAARERFYCSFQRADDSGRALAPSWYLSELKRVLGPHADRHLVEITLPRSVVDKSRFEPFSRHDLLLPGELAVRRNIEGEDSTSLVEASGLSPSLYAAGRKAAALLDRSDGRLHELDGLVGSSSDYWRTFLERGVSPTALETYARCPFQFFARHVLRLEPLELPEESTGPSTAEFGELGHEILKGCYPHLIDAGYIAGKPPDGEVKAIVDKVARQVFADYERKNPVGYPLAWEHLKESLSQLIARIIVSDLADMAVSGYIPIGFEVDRSTKLPADWPEPLGGAKIHGRMDRIDWNAGANRLRVVDYKFKFSAEASPPDKDLYRSALRGQRLQPPFYCLLESPTGGSDAPERAAEIEAEFHYIAPRWAGGPLIRERFGPDGLWGHLGAEIKKTIAYLLEGIHSGLFFIQRGDYCSYCDVAEICRKNHPPSLWRAENDSVTAPHLELRDKEPQKP